MNKSLLILLFIVLNFSAFPQLNQGDVLINSFEPALDHIPGREFVVLVNYTDSLVDLNGYEIQGFDYDGDPVTQDQGYFFRFEGETILQPYQFYLIANASADLPSVYGINPDTLNDNGSYIDDDGYLTILKVKEPPYVEEDYIDIVKYTKRTEDNVPFGGIPPGSGIDFVPGNPDLSMPIAVQDPDPPYDDTYLTRKGVSGNLSSLTYTGYGMVVGQLSDFDAVLETDDAYILASSSGPLPVELSSFYAAKIAGNEVTLKWRTETEVSNYGFDILRKTYNKNDWTKIGFVEGNGNSNSPKNYSFIDVNFINGSKFNYRLKQIDTDGKFEYSKIISVDIGESTKFELEQNYPNPFNPTTTIKFGLKEKTNVKIDVFNIIGQKVKTIINEIKEPGNYQVEFNASELPSGIYVYEIIAGNYIETRKMILTK